MHPDPLRPNFTHSAQQQFSADGGPLSLRQYACAPGSVRISRSARHTLIVNAGEKLSFTGNDELQFPSTLVADKASVICIVPAGSSAEASWQATASLAFLTFDCDYIVRLLAEVPDLRQRWNHSDPLVQSSCTRLLAAMTVPNFPERTYAESLTGLLFDSLSRNSRSIPHDQPGKGRLSPCQLKAVIAFAHDSMQLDIGLVDLAALVHLSAYHFGRLFKQTTGLSPYQYLLQMRIEYAKKLILEKAGPLGEIAYQLNFSDQAHFSNAFRKATGVSPRQFQHGQLAVL